MAKAKLSAKQKPPPPPEKIISDEAVGETIPTPENIQARKPSLVTSKLASGELLGWIFKTKKNIEKKAKVRKFEPVKLLYVQ